MCFDPTHPHLTPLSRERLSRRINQIIISASSKFDNGGAEGDAGGGEGGEGDEGGD